MPKSWKKLSSKTLLTHKRFTVYEDQVELPNGHQTEYVHFGKIADAAMVIGIKDDNKILVQKEYSYPPDEWLYQFPGGALDIGETPEKGALREFAEEAGFTGRLESLGWFYIDNRRRADKFYVFLATDLEPAEATKDAEEEFETYWFTVPEIEKLIEEGKIVNYSMLAAWALFRAKHA